MKKVKTKFLIRITATAVLFAFCANGGMIIGKPVKTKKTTSQIVSAEIPVVKTTPRNTTSKLSKEQNMRTIKLSDMDEYKLMTNYSESMAKAYKEKPLREVYKDWYDFFQSNDEYDNVDLACCFEILLRGDKMSAEEFKHLHVGLESLFTYYSSYKIELNNRIRFLSKIDTDLYSDADLESFKNTIRHINSAIDLPDIATTEDCYKMFKVYQWNDSFENNYREVYEYINELPLPPRGYADSGYKAYTTDELAFYGKYLRKQYLAPKERRMILVRIRDNAGDKDRNKKREIVPKIINDSHLQDKDKFVEIMHKFDNVDFWAAKDHQTSGGWCEGTWSLLRSNKAIWPKYYKNWEKLNMND